MAINIRKLTELDSLITEGTEEIVSHTVMLELLHLNRSSVMYCIANSNYTDIFFNDDKKFRAYKTLKIIEQTIKEPCFYRIRRSYIVNLNYVKSCKSDGSEVTLKDGTVLAVARCRRKKLLKKATGKKYKKRIVQIKA